MNGTSQIYWAYSSLLPGLLLLLSGCQTRPPDELVLMPTPGVFADGKIDPLPKEEPYQKIPYGGILYATDRAPAEPDSKQGRYANERGTVLRLGVGKAEVVTENFSWNNARQASLLESRGGAYTLRIGEIQEWGIHAETLPFYAGGRGIRGETLPPDATGRFVEAINAQLAESRKKHVYIYVHGYKVVFENPLLVASEFWHYLGYDGAFIAYAWPSTPNALAYVKDSETSAGFARNLRKLVETIAAETDAVEIHLIGYSNGTRLVARAIEQLSLKYHEAPREEIREKLRISNVILVASDVDRGVFGEYLADGFLNVPRHVTIYVNRDDGALGLSRLLTGRDRLGQFFDEESGPTYAARRLLTDYGDRISMINVSDLEGSLEGSGHAYFRASPSVSSDILAMFYYNLSPAERGLSATPGQPIFSFPPDYLDRLRQGIAEADPRLSPVSASAVAPK